MKMRQLMDVLWSSVGFSGDRTERPPAETLDQHFGRMTGSTNQPPNV